MPKSHRTVLELALNAPTAVLSAPLCGGGITKVSLCATRAACTTSFTM